MRRSAARFALGRRCARADARAVLLVGLLEDRRRNFGLLVLGVAGGLVFDEGVGGRHGAARWRRRQSTARHQEVDLAGAQDGDRACRNAASLVRPMSVLSLSILTASVVVPAVRHVPQRTCVLRMAVEESSSLVTTSMPTTPSEASGAHSPRGAAPQARRQRRRPPQNLPGSSPPPSTRTSLTARTRSSDSSR